MEETLEEKVALEEKVREDDQGGIRRRLRDRDLLKKRKAEAEARVTYQDESRKRAKREPSSTLKKKGRPKKNIIIEQEPGNSEIHEHETPEESTCVPTLVSVSVPAITSFPVLISPSASDSAPALPPAPGLISSPASVSAPAPGLISSPASVSAPALPPALFSPPVSLSVPFSFSAPIADPGSILEPAAVSVSAPSPASIQDSNTFSAPIPVPVSAPVSATVTIPDQASASDLNLQMPDEVSTPTFLSASETTREIKFPNQSPHGVLIEDLGPDEDDDKTRTQDKLGINQGGGVELSPGVAEQNKGFLDSVFVSSQHDSQPGNII